MSPTRTTPGGAYRLQWERKGFGRITRSSGSKTVAGWKLATATLDQLWSRGNHVVLRALQAGQMSMAEILSAENDRAFGRGDPIDVLTKRKLVWKTIDAWLSGDLSVTDRRYQMSLQKLRRVAALPKNATLHDLATIDWRALRTVKDADGWPVFKSAADWNHLRRAVSRFLTVALDDVYHPFRRAILKRIPRAKESPREVPFTAADLWALVAHVPDYVGPSIVTLAVTGMRLGEYLRVTPAHLMPTDHAIRVPGTKTKASKATVVVGEGLWPWIERAVPSPLRAKWLRTHFKRAAKEIGRPELVLHDLRHATAVFALAGAAPINAVRDLMRHESAGQSMDYAKAGNQLLAAEAIERVVLPSYRRKKTTRKGTQGRKWKSA